MYKRQPPHTPRDKDFITRYQLSQIVTDDPYNEDFYFQVYKIIQRGITASESNKDSIAKAYLEHSGHRLGGRYKRTDVALQRMQSQVEKAVTVAKERPQKNKDGLDSAKAVSYTHLDVYKRQPSYQRCTSQKTSVGSYRFGSILRLIRTCVSNLNWLCEI